MHFTYWLGHTIFRELARGFFDFRIIGSENLHFDGPAIIAANHVSFLDPPFIGQAFHEPLHFFARKTLFDHPLIGLVMRDWQTIPVDRDKPDTSGLKTTIRLLKSGKKILMFPEGTRSSNGKLQKAEAGVGLFLAKTGAPVLPVRIFGTFESLPRGGKFPIPTQVTLVIGQKYQPDLVGASARGRDLYQTVADEVMQRIAGLTL